VNLHGPLLAFTASEEFAALDDGWPYLRDALTSLGLVPTVAFWDDPDEQWDRYDLVVPIFSWGYVTRRAQFLSWSDQVAASSRLVNPAAVLRWNTDKTYLADLAEDGITIVPTVWVHRGSSWHPPADDYVIKPSVGSGGRDAARYRTQSVEVADGHVHRLHDEGYTVMVQPYQPTVDAAGETSIVFFGGSYSHALNKAALLRADVGVTDRLWEQMVITPVEPRNDQRTAAESVMRAVDHRFGPIGYGRVDLIDGEDGTPLVLELELVEPALFLDHAPDAALRFAVHLQSQVSRDARSADA
jgi:glutathione synthase/RimK-type ligase-like ATP-grasp enzyme